VFVHAVVLGVLALGLSLLLITHDLGVVASGVDEVVVPEQGRVPERGPIGASPYFAGGRLRRRLLEAARSYQSWYAS
jgi:ABC-type dipeptide/oligopeptide/nickel transport system ATPase component